MRMGVLQVVPSHLLVVWIFTFLVRLFSSCRRDGESDIVTCESTWHHVGVDGMRMRKNVAI